MDRVTDYSADQKQRALVPIASLISKSEQAQQKLASGTWQHMMLDRNLDALRTATTLMGAAGGEAAVSSDELTASLDTLAALIERLAATEAKFAPGTSQHSLQRNRLEALRVARATVEAELQNR